MITKRKLTSRKRGSDGRRGARVVLGRPLKTELKRKAAELEILTSEVISRASRRWLESGFGNLMSC